MLDKGDLDGYAVWRRVLRAVEELVRTEPIEGEPINSQRTFRHQKLVSMKPGTIYCFQSLPGARPHAGNLAPAAGLC